MGQHFVAAARRQARKIPVSHITSIVLSRRKKLSYAILIKCHQLQDSREIMESPVSALHLLTTGSSLGALYNGTSVIWKGSTRMALSKVCASHGPKAGRAERGWQHKHPSEASTALTALLLISTFLNIPLALTSHEPAGVLRLLCACLQMSPF